VAELALVIPVFGRDDLTAALLADVEHESDLVDVLVVDNKGDYAPRGFERVLQPGHNLGWLRACNLALTRVERGTWGAGVLLNNDTRLSPGFFAGLLSAWSETGAGLVGPVYNDVWPTQRVEYTGPAACYVPRRLHRRVPFLDGTCMLIPREVLRRVGGLDQRFARHGWGADFDLALRVRSEGLDVVVTRLAYLTHLRGATARLVDPCWESFAGTEMNDGMLSKWGATWHSQLEATWVDDTTTAAREDRRANTLRPA